MAGYNHLDAAALTQPGGFTDSLVRALAAAFQGYGAVQDRAAERQGNADVERARIGFQERQRKESRDQALSLALAKAGIVVPGADPREQELAKTLKADHDAEVANKKTEAEARGRYYDSQTALNGAKGVNLGLDKVLDGLGMGKKAQADKAKDPLVKNLGTDMEPDWRQWDGTKWIKPPMDGSGEVPPPAGQDPAAEPAAPAAPTSGGLIAPDSTLRRSGLPGVHSLGDLLGGIVDGWKGPDAQPSAHLGQEGVDKALGIQRASVMDMANRPPTPAQAPRLISRGELDALAKQTGKRADLLAQVLREKGHQVEGYESPDRGPAVTLDDARLSQLMMGP